jgi:hypothetical protein
MDASREPPRFVPPRTLLDYLRNQDSFYRLQASLLDFIRTGWGFPGNIAAPPRLNTLTAESDPYTFRTSIAGFSRNDGIDQFGNEYVITSSYEILLPVPPPIVTTGRPIGDIVQDIKQRANDDAELADHHNATVDESARFRRDHDWGYCSDTEDAPGAVQATPPRAETKRVLVRPYSPSAKRARKLL